jgi:hypothetical protein
VEHDLAGVKRCRIVKDVLRNTKDGCRMQSWKRPVDCTTFETRTQSGGSKPNENLIPEKVYCRVFRSFTVSFSRALMARIACMAWAAWPGRQQITKSSA